MANKSQSVEDLSLILGTVDEPFALVGHEGYLKPDDWAWQFLRLNESYLRDYAAALAESSPSEDSPRGAFWITDLHPARKVRVAEQYCRKEYGLSTWLDPQCARLPKLNPGESWFFPLVQNVAFQLGSGGEVPLEDVFSYYYVSARVGTGDRRLMGGRTAMTDDPEDRSKAWFAIDCSIPPSGQMTAVEFLVKGRRDWFLRNEQRSHKGSNAFSKVLPVRECGQFKAENFTEASGVLSSVKPSEVWYGICIDVLGPVKEQLEDRLVSLNEKFQEIYEAGIAPKPILKRFRSEIIGPRDVDGNILTDGHYLKAQVICTQLSKNDSTPDKIVDFIYKEASPSNKGSPEINGVRDKWVSDLEKRIVDYRNQARAFVKDGYRWLVHAQKP